MVLAGRTLETHLNKKHIGGWMPFPCFLKSSFGCRARTWPGDQLRGVCQPPSRSRISMWRPHAPPCLRYLRPGQLLGHPQACKRPRTKPANSLSQFVIGATPGVSLGVSASPALSALLAGCRCGVVATGFSLPGQGPYFAFILQLC